MVRRLALMVALALAVPSATAAPADKTFAEVAEAAKHAYDAALAELGARGAKARAAAAAGDAATWAPLNDAYGRQLAEVAGICDRNVAALTHDAKDLEQTPAKTIVQAFTQYADVAGSMTTVRLQLLGFASLLAHLGVGDRAAILKALAPKYFVGT